MKHAIDQVRDDCREALAEGSGALEPLRGANVTVVGGTGFVGTWLAEMVACLNDEHGFGTRLALVSRGVEAFRSRLPHLGNRRDFSFIQSDVRYAFEIPRETQYLIHAAATPDTRFHASRPVETMTVIGNGTEVLLRAAERCSQFRMFLNFSSGLVYGPQPANLERISEQDPSLVPSGLASSYAEAKRYGELLCQSFRSQNRLPVITVRPFAFMGPHQSLESPWAITNFILDAISRRPIRVLGDGSSVRSYMYPSDLAFWTLRILTGGESGSVFNLGSPESISLRELAEKVSTQFSPRPEILLSAGGATADRSKSRLVPDVTAARERLGLSIRVPLDVALERTIEWYSASPRLAAF